MDYLTLLKIFGPLVILSLALGWFARVDHLRAGYAADLQFVGADLSKAANLKPFRPDRNHLHQAVAALAGERDAAAHDRDVYQGNWQRSREAVVDQTQRVVALGEETKRLRALSDRERAMVAQLKAQRAGWISRAQQAATRTERKAAEAEAAECSAAMDALYKAGF